MVHLHLRVSAPRDALAAVLARLETDLRASHLRHAGASQPPEPHARDVSAALHRLGWKHQAEYALPRGAGFVLHAAQPHDKAAVHYDGPEAHVVALGPGNLSKTHLAGGVRAEDKLLRGLGWNVVRVPFFEWIPLETEADQEDYLQSRLNEPAR